MGGVGVALKNKVNYEKINKSNHRMKVFTDRIDELNTSRGLLKAIGYYKCEGIYVDVNL